MDPIAFRPYRDPEEYILASTDDIWRDRGIGRIASEYYGQEVLVHSAYGTTPGVAPVTAGTTMRISSYPTRFAKGEDVVWEARSERSFISSHRIFSTGRHLGWNQYGPPTNRDFTMRALAHCLVREGRVVEEWLVRDEYNLVTCLGYDPREVAGKLAARNAYRRPGLRNVTDDPITSGVSGPRMADDCNGDCARILELAGTAWNQRMLHRIGGFVHPAVVLHTTRGRRVQGAASYTDHIIDLLACFPDAQLRIIDLCAHDHPRRGRRIGAVWTLEGTYDGAPEYGPATGGRVHILGSSQYVMDGGVIVEEYRVYDEIALLTQIEQARQGAAMRHAGGNPVTDPE